MIIHKVILFLLCATFTTVSASLDDLPSCAVGCLTQSFDEAGCAQNDTACACQNRQFVGNVNDCALWDCSSIDQIVAAQMIASTCGYRVRNRSSSFIASIWSLTILSCITVAIRLVSRLPRKSVGALRYGLDDTLIIIALISLFPASVLNQLTIPLGFGYDIWGFNPDNIEKLSLYQYLEAICYLTSTTITKASLLIFLARIFPSKTFRAWCWAVLIIMTVMNVVMTFLYTFQCTPISFVFTDLNDPIPGPDDDATCINMNIWRWLSGISTIFWDVVIIILPLPQVYRLNLPARKKLYVGLMFSSGLVVIATVCGECAYLTTETSNPTWDYVPLLSLFSAEACICIICACMPALHAFVKIYFPNWSGSSMNRTKGSKGSAAPLTSGASKSHNYSEKKTTTTVSSNKITMTRSVDISWDDPEEERGRAAPG